MKIRNMLGWGVIKGSVRAAAWVVPPVGLAASAHHGVVSRNARIVEATRKAGKRQARATRAAGRKIARHS